MYVPKEVQSGVAFIYANVGGEKTPAGTAFFVSIRDTAVPETPVSMKGWTYVVTARHVIEDIRSSADDAKVIFRLNRRKGATEFIETDASDWVFHPTDPMIDVAVLSWLPPFGDFEISVLNQKTFATDEIIERDSIGTGDEVFITGLFSKRVGLGRNIPIVRIGNIAAMPTEAIDSEVGKASGGMHAYLVEARSIGGLSGSPVFVNLGPIRRMRKKWVFMTNKRSDPSGVFYLLGLVHGHWDEKDTGKTFPLSDKRINMGIALVTPAQSIMEVLSQASLQLQRQRDKEIVMKNNRPTRDTSLLARSVVEAAIGEPLTQLKPSKDLAKKSPKCEPK